MASLVLLLLLFSPVSFYFFTARAKPRNDDVNDEIGERGEPNRREQRYYTEYQRGTALAIRYAIPTRYALRDAPAVMADRD